MKTAQPRTDELAGRVALVTGAAQGQGRAIARRLHDAGAAVVAGDVARHLLEEVGSELGEQGLAAYLDVRDSGSWSDLLEQTVSRFGRLDILVNNAGVLHRLPLDEETEDGFRKLWEINCLGPFLGMKAALPHLRRSDHAAIVNTSSTGGRTAWSSHSSYVSSKWGVLGLTKAVALELAPEGIRVNAVLPGPIATPMTISEDDPGAVERLSKVPLGRIGVPEDIAEAVLFLVSDRSAYLTGSEITVDGGQMAGVLFTGPSRTPTSG